MPITQDDKTIDIDGEVKEAITFAFTNAAKGQLQELQEFFKAPTPLDLIQLAIAFLQRLKELEKEKQKTDAKTN